MKIKHLLITFSIIGIIIVLILGVKWTKRFFQKDSCFDNGGRWNNELNKCEPCYKLDSLTICDYYWSTDYDTILNKEYLIRGKMMDSISKSPNELIEILNMRKPKCKIEYVDFTGDTIKIRILEDEYLTERMGTTGAECYLGETIYTLTEDNLTKFVRIEMDYGSHASPGVYSRNDFKNLIREK